jgi:serine protease Do
MKRLLSSVAALMLTLVTVVAAASELPDFVTLAKKYGPAVVNISSRQTLHGRIKGFGLPDLPEDSPLRELFRHFFGDQKDAPDEELQGRSLGSGFFISSDGYILTNHHVVDGADEVMVRTNDRREFKAKVIGSDRRSDTALIKVDIKDAPVVEIGSAKSLQVGAWVLAIGSPFGFDHSVTQGIVSAMGRSLPSENYVPFIQTDVAINPGNSGGPLIDLDGKVVGVNSQIYSRTGGFMGLSFAIPIDLAMNVAEQIKTKGHVSRGWLGVMIQDVTRDLAETFGMVHPRGALVAQVLRDSPAEHAGIQVGDVIVSYNGHDLPTSAALPPMVGTSPVDRPSSLRILRHGKEMEIKVTIGELPEDDNMPKLGALTPKGMPPDRLGLIVRDLTDKEREELGLKSGEGAVVEKLANGPAKEAGLQVGDVILMLNNTAVRGAAELRDQIDALPAGHSVAILVQRDDSRMFMALRFPK